jgi:hypothetical protein
VSPVLNMTVVLSTWATPVASIVWNLVYTTIRIERPK